MSGVYFIKVKYYTSRDVYKIGRPTDIKNRFNSYNSDKFSCDKVVLRKMITNYIFLKN